MYRGRLIKSKIIGIWEKYGGGEVGWMKWDLNIRVGVNVDRIVGSLVLNINFIRVILRNILIFCKCVIVGLR